MIVTGTKIRNKRGPLRLFFYRRASHTLGDTWVIIPGEPPTKKTPAPAKKAPAAKKKEESSDDSSDDSDSEDEVLLRWLVVNLVIWSSPEGKVSLPMDESWSNSSITLHGLLWRGLPCKLGWEGEFSFLAHLSFRVEDKIVTRAIMDKVVSEIVECL
ncbi:hypothetical protein MKW98_023101 [Papaver atlanticum]|uniref:Uncharacterized protein n=1 Tax=Papaver atlanticum TaxID=357466 RepID=A0AAD4TAN9_9MAGN|nr:hypothetical protein MKW98_023101 [Papaver atlanticum]